MGSWIKICGLTTAMTVNAAVEAGADAVGFVFAPSKRQLTPVQAAEIAVKVPARVARVAVMQHPTQEQLDEVWSVFGPDVLQTDYEDIASLRVPTELQVLPVVRVGRNLPLILPSRLLLEGAVSGSGETTDWTRAAQLAKHHQLILAGGLHPANVAEAIQAVRPYGVDVSSGVEGAPGIKDPAKVAAFVQAARAAFARLGSARRTDISGG